VFAGKEGQRGQPRGKEQQLALHQDESPL